MNGNLLAGLATFLSNIIPIIIFRDKKALEEKAKRKAEQKAAQK